jgi:hypothetical protein
MSNSQTVALFDPDRLVPGDIVLERGGGVGSTVVAAATGGPFSHALIWVGSDFVEAMPGGVRNLSFARVPVVVAANWALLRAKPEHRSTSAAAANAARNMIFESYDSAGAVMTQIGGRQDARPGARFCSQLIAEAYRRAGLDLVPDRRPEQITPNMLLRATTHDRVPLPLIDATAINGGKPYPSDFLDRSKAFRNAPMRREGEINRELFKSVEDLVALVPLPTRWRSARPASFSETLDLLPLLPVEHSIPIADRLLEAMEHTGYFHLLVPALADLWPRVGTGHRDHIPGWVETRDRYLQNYGACSERFLAMPHQIWDRLRRMYLMNANAFDGLIEKVSEGN